MKKTLLFGLMFILLVSSVYATMVGESYYNVDSSNNGTCIILGDSGCNRYNRYISWNRFKPDTSIYGSVIGEVTDGAYNFEFEYRIYDVVRQSPYNTSIKEFGTYCYTYYYNGSKNIIFNETYTPDNYTTSDSWQRFKVELDLEGQFYCRSYTEYYNSSVLYDLIADRVILHYASIPYTYPLNYEITLENKDAEIEDLKSRLVGEQQSNFDKIANNVSSLITMNMNVLLILYWVFMILLGFLAIGLLIYVIFWLYNFFKRLVNG